jgi:hypothetical protein
VRGNLAGAPALDENQEIEYHRIAGGTERKKVSFKISFSSLICQTCTA